MEKLRLSPVFYIDDKKEGCWSSPSSFISEFYEDGEKRFESKDNLYNLKLVSNDSLILLVPANWSLTSRDNIIYFTQHPSKSIGASISLLITPMIKGTFFTEVLAAEYNGIKEMEGVLDARVEKEGVIAYNLNANNSVFHVVSRFVLNEEKTNYYTLTTMIKIKEGNELDKMFLKTIIESLYIF